MSDIDGAIDAFLGSARTTAAVAPNGSPERTAKALDLSTRSGVPVDVIQLNIEAASEQIAQQERAAAVRQSPELQAYVNSSPIAAQVSSDDFGPLQSFLDEVKNFADSDPMVKAVRDNFDTTTPLGFQPGGEAEEFFRSVGLFKDPNRADPGALVTEPVIRAAAAAVDLLARTTVAATAGLGAGVEEIVRSANEAVGGQPFGNPGRANREMQNFVNFWLLKMGFDSPVMLNPDYPLSNRTFQFLKKTQETKPEGTAPPKAPWQVDPLQLQLEYFTTKAEFDAAQLDAAVQAATETATRQRAPAVFQGMVEQNLGDRTVGVSAQALRDLYKTEGVVPGPGDALMGFVPDIAERLKIALATGTDVEVPFAAYLAHVDPKVNEALLPNIRSRGGMTIEEAKAAGEELQAAMEAKTPQLSYEQRLDIGNYTFGTSDPLNATLRGEKQTTYAPEEINRLIGVYDEAIAQSPVSYSMNLTRSIFGEEARILDELPVGETYTSPQFLSTTSKKGLYTGTGDNAKEITIKVSEGANALNVQNYSAHKGENEFILPRGTTLRKTGENEFEVVLPEKAGMAPFTGNETISADKPLVSGEGPLLNATTLDLPGINLPPVSEGSVRVYHSGRSYSGGPRWVSTSPTYVNYRSGATAFYADIPEAELRAIPGAYDEINNYYHNVEIPEELAQRLIPITENNIVKGAEPTGPIETPVITDITEQAPKFGVDIDNQRTDLPVILDTEKLLRIESNGQELHAIVRQEGNELRVRYVGPNNESQPANIGPAQMRLVLDQIAEMFPSAEFLTGNRISGARTQKQAETDVRIPIKRRGPIETAVTKTADDLYLSPLFKDAKSAGMTEPEFALYSKRLEAAVTAAREADLRRLERQTTRELTQEWKATYAEELAKAEAEFDSRRDVVAARFIRDGSLVPGVGTGTPNPLEVTALGGVRLPKGMAIKGGVEPDEIAGLLGYATGAELVEDLGRLTAQQGRKSDASFRGAITKEVAQERTLERFGDPGERAQAVIDLLAEQDISDVLHRELQALWKQGGGVEPLSLEVIKDWVDEAFNRMKMKDASNVKKWANGVQKAGRQAELALLRGDIEKAFKAKNEQLISTLMLQNALKVQRGLPRLTKPKKASVAAPRKGISGPRKKTAKVLINTYTGKVPKAVAPEYAVQIQRILQGFGYKTKANPETLAEAPSLAEFVMERADSGWEPAVAYQLYDPLFYRPMSELSVAEYDVVIESLRSLDYLGRAETKVIREGKKADLDETIAEIERRVGALPYRRRSESGPRETQRTWRYAFDSRLVKMEEIIDDLDLQDPLGPLNQTVFVPIVKGEYKEMDLFKETAERLKGVRLANPRRTVVNTEFINSMNGGEGAHNPYRFTRADVVMMALNFGNARNRELLVNTLLPIEGGLGPEMRAMELRGAAQQVLDFIDRNLTKEDWDFVQAIWDYFKWIKPQVDEVYERLSGVAPDTMEATPFVTSHGEMPGGYIPILSDPNRSKAAAAREKSLFDSSYHKATTPNGYVKPRTQGSMDPMLVQNAYEILQHRIRAIIHDIALREAVLQAGKILTNRKVREIINKHYGPEYVETFGPWLRYVANHFNEEDKNLGIIARMMRTGRQNMAIVVLGLNLKTILTPNVGPAIRALKDLGVTPSDMNFSFMNWGQLYDFALERSQELQHRKANMDRDVSDILRNVVGMSTKYQRAQARAAEFGMALTAKIDQALATMVWNAEYRKALQEGRTEVEAAEIGDKQVRKYHGSASPANLAALFRGGETSKTLTVFMQFMNMIYNRQRAMVRMAQKMPGIEVIEQGANAGGKRDFAKLLSDFFAITIPTALFTALYDPGTVDDEDWGGTVGKLLLSSLAGSIPFAREIYSYAVQGLPPRNPGIVQVVTNLIDSSRDLTAVLSDDDPSDKWVKHAINVPGYLLGLPTGQMANSAQYLWNVSVGEDNMDDFGDFVKGMIYGTTEVGK